MLRPSTAAVTLLAPKMSTGVYNGSTSNETSTPPPRKPSVSAAPTLPNRLSTGVPSSSDTTSVPMASAGNCNCNASSGDNSTSGSPVSTQWAAVLASTNTVNG